MSYAESTQETWKQLVRFALSISERGYEERIRTEAEAAGSRFGLLKRKCDAIRFQSSEGRSEEEIVQAGQSATLSAYVKHRRKWDEKTRMLRFRVPVSLFDAIQNPHASADSEEPLITRLSRVCQIRTSNELWEFLLSVFADLSDKDIAGLAGIEQEKKKRSGNERNN